MGGGELLGVVVGLHAVAEIGDVERDGLDMRVLALAEELCLLRLFCSFEISKETDGSR